MKIKSLDEDWTFWSAVEENTWKIMERDNLLFLNNYLALQYYNDLIIVNAVN